MIAKSAMPMTSFVLFIGTKEGSKDVKKMDKLISSNATDNFTIKKEYTKNGFDNYKIVVNATTKELAIQKIVIFLTENEFDNRTIETFKTKASQPKVEKPKVENVLSSSADTEPLNSATAQVSEKKPKVVKVQKSNLSSEVEHLNSANSTSAQVSEKKPKVVKVQNSNSSSEDITSNLKEFELSFGVFTTSNDKSTVDLNLEQLKFIHVSTTGKFDNYKMFVKASSKAEAIEKVVEKLVRIGVSAKTIENFKEKSSK